MHSPPSASYTHLTKFWIVVVLRVQLRRKIQQKTFHHNLPIGRTKTSVAGDFGLRSVRLIA